MIRKITPVVFLIIFFLPVCSVYFLFSIRKSEIYSAVREEIQSGVDESRIVLLKIPINEEKYGDFQRTEDHEFRYKGKMYDVSKTEQHGDTTWYYAVWDVEETELEEEVKDATAKVTGADAINDITKKNISIFLQELFIQVSNHALHLPYTDTAAWAAYLNPIHLNITNSPPSPPPEL